VSYEPLIAVIQALFPLQPNSPSEGVFTNTLPRIFRERRDACARKEVPFTIDPYYLRDSIQWSTQTYVQDAIHDRLDMVAEMELFQREVKAGTDGACLSLREVYEEAAASQPIVFDLRDLGESLRRALVKAVGRCAERICEAETRRGSNRYPYLVFDEAHLYLKEDAILGLITRGRHIGIASIFVTNTPEQLPAPVFRQLDNLVLLGLTHQADIRAVSKSSFTDEETIDSLATRMPRHHALVVGAITDNYPMVVEICPLPASVPTTGQTRSTWQRF
jgi:hypothetical protein